MIGSHQDAGSVFSLKVQQQLLKSLSMYNRVCDQRQNFEGSTGPLNVTGVGSSQQQLKYTRCAAVVAQDPAVVWCSR
jgi:hypothetical protein